MPQFLTAIDLTQNELKNAVIHVLSSAPGAPATGQVYYDSVTNILYYRNNSGWVEVRDGVDTNTASRTVKRDSNGDFAARIGTFAGTGSHSGITLSGTVTNATDAVTKAYVDALSSGVSSMKSACEWTTTGDITLSGLGTQANGEWSGSLTAADRILVKDQADPTENGIYAAAAGAWARTADADAGTELPGAYVLVKRGATYADRGFVCTNDSVTLGATNIVFVEFSGVSDTVAGAGLARTGNVLSVNVDNSTIEINSDTLRVKDAGVTYAKIQNVSATDRILGRFNSGAGVVEEITCTAAGRNLLDDADAAAQRTTLSVPGKYATDVGDGAATSYVVTHSLGTRDVTVTVRDNSSPYAIVHCDMEATSTSTVTVRFAVAPTSNKYRVIVHG